jgi:large subunit ribosomal protein L25
MAEVRLTAESRTEFGKGAARRIRRAHKVPAVLYGHGTDPVHVTLPGHDTMMALKTANVLLSIDVDGAGQQLALPKHVQRDPLRHTIEHVDLLLVRRGEKVTVDVPIQIVGDAMPGTVVTQEASTLAVEALATAIPAALEVPIAQLEAGSMVHAGDVALPDGTTLAADPESLVVLVAAEQAEIEETAEAESGEPAAAVAAEPAAGQDASS